MKESEFKPIAKKIIRELGLEVEDIPRKDSKTPDFDAHDKNSKYIIELKIKEDNPEERRKESKTLTHGHLVTRSTPIGGRNRLYGLIKEGAKQLVEYDPQHNAFHIIWLHSAGRDPVLLNMRFYATLFGTQDLFSLRQKSLIKCYYFHESIFYSCRNELDGAILTHHDKAQLCINTFSPQLKKLRNSELYKSLSQGLCDPGLRHNSKNVMVADCNIDRKETKQIISYLCAKYSVDHLQTIDLKKHSAMIAFPEEKNK